MYILLWIDVLENSFSVTYRDSIKIPFVFDLPLSKMRFGPLGVVCFLGQPGLSRSLLRPDRLLSLLALRRAWLAINSFF
jgi:hypothetical protein